MPAQSARSRFRRLQQIALPSLLLAALVGCASKTQQTAIEIGGGMRKGEPPLCYQHRSEVRANALNTNDVWLHVNNSCSYPVDCNIYDDVSDTEHRYALGSYQNASYVLARNVDAKRVDVELECVWKP